ncbi:MAG: hypothetical protein MUF65_07060 [Rubritepida sp.]|jgi:hypothetical protein|nr:hypothetical protein [Rubritepida sp.]MCU0945111.1 hypothetical protein [Rubritepida sp.]
MAHANPATFGRLVGALDHPDVSVFVHLDQRAELAPFAALATPRVTFLEARIANYWGAWTQVEATLRLLRAARAAGPFTSYAVVSGDSLPLLPPAALLAELHAAPTRLSFRRVRPGSTPHRRVTGIYLPHVGWGRIRERVDWMERGLDPADFDDLRAAMATAEAKANIDFPVFKSSQWMALSDAAAEALLDLVESDRPFVDIFRFSLIPDESFIVTALHRLDRSLRSTDDFMGFDWPKGPSPRVILGPEHLPLVEASPGLFFRKFSDDGGAAADAWLARLPGRRAEAA